MPSFFPGGKSQNPDVLEGDPHLQIAPLALLVVDNDTPGILVTPTNGATRVFENGPADTLEVRLTRAPAGTVTVALTCDADQVSLDRTELTFTPADWHQGQTVVVQAVDTAGRDGNRPTVIRAEVIGSAGDYEGVSADLISAEDTEELTV